MIRVVLHGRIGVGSFSLGRNRFPTGRCPYFGLCVALPVLWVVIAVAAVAVIFTTLLRVLCEEIESQFGHFCRINSLVFLIDVLLLEFFFREWDKFRDEPEVLPCMLVIERVNRRCLVIVKSKPEEGTGTRRRRNLDREKQIEKIDILVSKMVVCHSLGQPGELNGEKKQREENER